MARTGQGLNMAFRRCGGAVLCVLFAAYLSVGTTEAATTVDAIVASIRSSGRSTKGAWLLNTNGTVGEYVRIRQAGSYDVVVRAYGTPLGGVWPLMAVTVDWLAVQLVSVSANESRDYVFRLELPAGVRAIGAAFLNDAWIPGREDRNLYVQRIEIRRVSGSAGPALAREQEWALQAKAREDAAVKDSYEAIRRNRTGAASITVMDGNGTPLPGISVTVELKQHSFLFGSNIFMFDKLRTDEENATYKTLFRAIFNYATLPFYWRSFEPEEGKPNYAYIDKVVAWCEKNKIRMKGHPLLWGESGAIPSWSTGQPPTETQRRRVSEVLRRYGDKIEAWEVVNEPTRYPGIPIDNAYRWARDASPAAHLIVNEFGVLSNGYPPFLEFLEAARQRGVPFDGIGVQAHDPLDMAFPLDRVRSILDRYATLGKAIHITEFIPTSNGKSVGGSPWRGVWTEAEQADYAEKFYRVGFAHPAVVAITWWDIVDRAGWRESGGMLRKDLSPKPVYERLRKLIREEWNTVVQGRTDSAGRFQFSGFYGLYRVSLQMPSASRETELSLVAAGQNDFTYQLDPRKR